MKNIFLLLTAALTVALITSGCRTAATGPAGNIFQKTVQAAGNKVYPSLVYIRVQKTEQGGGSKRVAHSSGSGVIISPDGEVVSNFHVVDKAASIRCLLNDGRAFNARLIGQDKDTDLALLKLDLPKDTTLNYARFARRPVQEGEFVMALGAPWGLSRSVSIGIISCARRYLPGHSLYSLWYQTDAAISPGNSGGPLINTDGEIVGINTLGMFSAGAIAFTIPSPTVEVILPRLRKYKKVNWAWFGLNFQPLEDFDRNIYLPYKQGVLIDGTDANSPARRAGIEANDLLLAIDGVPITVKTEEELPQLRRQLGLIPFGQKVNFTIERNGKKMVIVVAAAEKGRVEGTEFACPGWDFSAKSINRFDNPNLYFYREKGVFVSGLKRRGQAMRSGLKNNDIIISINNQEITALEDLQKVFHQIRSSSNIYERCSFTVMRNGMTLQLVIPYVKND